MLVKAADAQTPGQVGHVRGKEEGTGLQDQDILACVCELVGQYPAAHTRTDDDDVPDLVRVEVWREEHGLDATVLRDHRGERTESDHGVVDVEDCAVGRQDGDVGSVHPGLAETQLECERPGRRLDGVNPGAALELTGFVGDPAVAVGSQRDVLVRSVDLGGVADGEHQWTLHSWL